jgi:rRNA maturation endonuclease Nob1
MSKGRCINCGKTATLDNGDNCPECAESWKEDRKD